MVWKEEDRSGRVKDIRIVNPKAIKNPKKKPEKRNHFQLSRLCGTPVLYREGGKV
jgi:hypothetical protein